MANNVLGTKITDLEEAQAAGLTDDALLIVESETPPTKRSKLSTFFTWIRGKLAAWILSSYDEVMAATEAGYLVDALAIKGGFAQLNTKLSAVSKQYTGGLLAGTMYADRIGNTVSVNYGGDITKAPAGETTIATLDAPFRPMQRNIVASTRNSNYQITVYPDGRVALYNYGSAYSGVSVCRFSFTYLTDSLF